MKFVLVGLVSGFFSGLGIGGGTILILLLNTILGVQQHISQAATLIFFIPTSIVAILTNIKNKKINLKLAFIVSTFGILGAAIGALLATKTKIDCLQKLFGIFLFIIAANEIQVIIKEYIKNKKET